MTLDADLYRTNLKDISNLTNGKTAKERLEMLGGLAVITGVPIIVVGYYLSELHGMDADLQAAIVRLKNFYTVTDVYNVR